MSEDNDPGPFFTCSRCYTPCSDSDAHVIPGWRADQHRILTTYRCSNCLVASLDETRTAATSGELDVIASFCDFLARHCFTKDAEAMRAAPPEEARATLLAILDAV